MIKFPIALCRLSLLLTSCAIAATKPSPTVAPIAAQPQPAPTQPPLETPAATTTALPMSIAAAGAASGYEFSLHVTDTDVDRPAYGGKLTLYQAHVAKMFEVTQHLCTTPTKHNLSQTVEPSVYQWNYHAPNRRIRSFTIACSGAAAVVDRYGTITPETTRIKVTCCGTRVVGTEQLAIPVLAITGDRIGKWQDFVNQLR
jgi:hypothetical protein